MNFLPDPIPDTWESRDCGVLGGHSGTARRGYILDLMSRGGGCMDLWLPGNTV